MATIQHSSVIEHPGEQLEIIVYLLIEGAGTVIFGRH